MIELLFRKVLETQKEEKVGHWGTGVFLGSILCLVVSCLLSESSPL